MTKFEHDYNDTFNNEHTLYSLLINKAINKYKHQGIDFLHAKGILEVFEHIVSKIYHFGGHTIGIYIPTTLARGDFGIITLDSYCKDHDIAYTIVVTSRSIPLESRLYFRK